MTSGHRTENYMLPKGFEILGLDLVFCKMHYEQVLVTKIIDVYFL